MRLKQCFKVQSMFIVAKLLDSVKNIELIEPQARS